MTSPAHADPNGGFVKNEPVIAAHLAAWLVLNGGVLLVSRYHVVTGTQWSALSVELTSLITGVLLFVMGWLIRRVVSPAWKVAETEAKRFGINLPDPFAADSAASAPATPAADAPLTTEQIMSPLPPVTEADVQKAITFTKES